MAKVATTDGKGRTLSRAAFARPAAKQYLRIQAVVSTNEYWLRFAKKQRFSTFNCIFYYILLLVISRIARSRRAMARLSYRSNFRNSGSALRMASAVRSGSWVGIVAKGSTASGRMGSALPNKMDLRYRISSVNEPKTRGASSVPNADTHCIRATLTCRTRARSNSACAAVRACSITIAFLLLPAILRANSSSHFAIAALDGRLEVRPWR
jgi:hypothetical protein